MAFRFLRAFLRAFCFSGTGAVLGLVLSFLIWGRTPLEFAFPKSGLLTADLAHAQEQKSKAASKQRSADRETLVVPPVNSDKKSTLVEDELDQLDYEIKLLQERVAALDQQVGRSVAEGQKQLPSS